MAAPVHESPPAAAGARCKIIVRRGALFLFVYFILLFHINDFVGDGMARATMTLTLAIVEKGTLTIDDYLAGNTELAYHDGHFYSGMPPGQSMVAVPIYWVLRPAVSIVSRWLQPAAARVHGGERHRLDVPYVTRYTVLLVLFQVLVALPAAALVPVLVYDLMAEAIGHEAQPPCLALLLPLGTLWWAYGAGSGPRTMGTCLLLLPIWWVVCRRERAPENGARWAAAGLGAGLALAAMIRYEFVVPGLIVVVWFMCRARRGELTLLLLGLALFGGAGLWYHDRCYGGPLRPAYSRKLTPIPGIEGRWGHSAEGLERVEVNGTIFAVNDECRSLGLRPGNISTALWASPESLLRFTPALILAPWGLWCLWRRGSGARAIGIGATTFVAVGLALLMIMPHAGFEGSVGPRYVLWTLPFWMLLIAPVWVLLPNVVRWLLFGLSFAPSYLAGMFTQRLDSAWNFGLVGRWGLGNYLLSRAQEAGLPVSPAMSTVIALGFWALAIIIFFWPRSPWCMLSCWERERHKPPPRKGDFQPAKGGDKSRTPARPMA